MSTVNAHILVGQSMPLCLFVMSSHAVHRNRIWCTHDHFVQVHRCLDVVTVKNAVQLSANVQLVLPRHFQNSSFFGHAIQTTATFAFHRSKLSRVHSLVITHRHLISEAHARTSTRENGRAETEAIFHCA